MTTIYPEKFNSIRQHYHYFTTSKNSYLHYLPDTVLNMAVVVFGCGGSVVVCCVLAYSVVADCVLIAEIRKTVHAQ